MFCMSRRSNDGKYMRFPKKDQPQLGSASPVRVTPAESTGIGPASCRAWLSEDLRERRSLVRCFHIAGASASLSWGGGGGSAQTEILHLPQNARAVGSLGQKPEPVPRSLRIQRKGEEGEGHSWHSQHSQLAEAEWKNHHWMYFLCHSEGFWVLHRPSLSAQKAQAYLICLLRCPKNPIIDT